jgi:hypothetical protein
MLFVTKITEEAAGNEEGVTTNCTELMKVKEAVDRLDGETKTAVVLERDSQNFMVIGGGKNNKYVVYAQLKGKPYAMANKFPIPGIEDSEITINGKTGVYPSRRCLGLSMVLEAAKHFADRGALAQVFNWENP